MIQEQGPYSIVYLRNSSKLKPTERNSLYITSAHCSGIINQFVTRPKIEKLSKLGQALTLGGVRWGKKL